MSPGTRPLADRILAIAMVNPGVNTIAICRELRVRKSDVLAELEELHREQLLRFQTGHRGSKCWFVVSKPSSCSRTCSRGAPGTTSDSGLAEREPSP
jgi:hypothetical protein